MFLHVGFQKGWTHCPGLLSRRYQSFQNMPELEPWYEDQYVVTLLVWCPGSGESDGGILASQPDVSPLSMSGGGTRGFWALSNRDGFGIHIRIYGEPFSRV